MAKPRTLQFDRKLFRHAKASPFGRGGSERSELTERASLLKVRPSQSKPCGFASSPERGSFFVSGGQRLREASPAGHSKLSRAAKKAAAQKVQRLCGVSHHSQRSEMIHHIPGRLIRPSRCSNTISMVFSFQTVRFQPNSPFSKNRSSFVKLPPPKRLSSGPRP